MRELNDFLSMVDAHFGGSQWFVYLLLGTGLFYTIYLGFPQIRFFRHAGFPPDPFLQACD